MRQLDNREAMLLLATNTFKPFESADWTAFAGANAEKPLIAYTDEFVLIIDQDDAGEWVMFVSGNTDETAGDGGELYFHLSQQVVS